jgi:hypothetical protein
MNWAENYTAWWRNTLKCEFPAEIRQMYSYAVYPQESPYFKMAIDALFGVETKFAEELLTGIRRANIPGDIVEFGVFQGDWLKRLDGMMSHVGLKRDLWGFDSFQGLSKPDAECDISFWKEGMYACSLEEASRNVKAAKKPYIRLVPGFFSDSLGTAQAQALGPVAYARIDCDIYAPALECLHFLSERLSNGAILVFDDWNHDIEFGEARAFNKWSGTVPNLSFEFLGHGAWGHLYLKVYRG